MLSGTHLKTFLRNLLPQPSGQKSKPCGNNRVRCGERQKGQGSIGKPITDRGHYKHSKTICSRKGQRVFLRKCKGKM